MRFTHIVVAIAVEQFPRLNVLGIVIAYANTRGRRLHFLEDQRIVFVVGLLPCGGHGEWMAMIVDHLDRCNLARKLGIDIGYTAGTSGQQGEERKSKKRAHS